jgi:glycosyltransferase involved in cell wall biosynthesis
MRICIVTSSYPRFDEDGNARFVRSIAEAQASLGHQVHVIAPYTPQVRQYVSPVKLHWFRYVLPARWGVMGHAAALENDQRLRGAALWQAPLFGLSLSFAVQRLVSSEKIDLIHAHWVIPSGFVASFLALLNRKPLFISLHGSDMYLAYHNLIWRSMASWVFRHAQGITACSQHLADTAIQMGALPEHVYLIPYGADPVRFSPRIPSAELRQKLGIALDALIILAVGRLVDKKGFAQLVRAMPEVLIQVPRAHLIILGEGPQRTLLERLRHELRLEHHMLLPGAVPWVTVADYLAASDVFVMPSIRDVTGNLDGLPNVILEAMAAGRPVIATHIAGIPLVVQNNVTGILLDEAKPEFLSRALVRLLTSPEERRAMGLAGRARVEKELNWEQVANRFDHIYHATWKKYYGA